MTMNHKATITIAYMVSVIALFTGGTGLILMALPLWSQPGIIAVIGFILLTGAGIVSTVITNRKLKHL